MSLAGPSDLSVFGMWQGDGGPWPRTIGTAVLMPLTGSWSLGRILIICVFPKGNRLAWVYSRTSKQKCQTKSKRKMEIGVSVRPLDRGHGSLTLLLIKEGKDRCSKGMGWSLGLVVGTQVQGLCSGIHLAHTAPSARLAPSTYGLPPS